MAGNDSYTRSLLHFNGVDESVVFTDSASGGTHIWTPHGTAQIDTAQSKFGGASGLFDGNSDWIDTPASTDWNFAALNFTIDFWQKFNVSNTRQALFELYQDANNRVTISYYGDTDGSIHFYARNTAGVICEFYTGAWTPGTGWNHIAIVRVGNTPLILLNGVSVALTEGTTISGKTLPELTGPARIGYDGTNYYNGWIDEFRVSNGIARWTADFTPPTSEYALASNQSWFALEVPAVEIDLTIFARALSFELDIPPVELSASISQGVVLQFPLEVPALELAGSIKSGERLSASLPIPALTLSFRISPANVINAGLRIPALRLSGTLVSGGVLSGAIEIPSVTLVLTLAHQNRLALALDIPCIVPWLEIRGLPGLVPVRKGLAMNLSHFGVTEYSNFPLNSFANYHLSGVYVGASEEGIFLLDGEDDNGVKIEAAIQTGTEDLWKDFIKRLREGWAVKRGGPLSVQLVLDEGRSNPVTRDLLSVRNVMHEERVKFPHGLPNRFVSFIFKNPGGGDFDFESFRAMVDLITHRKR